MMRQILIALLLTGYCLSAHADSDTDVTKPLLQRFGQMEARLLQRIAQLEARLMKLEETKSLTTQAIPSAPDPIHPPATNTDSPNVALDIVDKREQEQLVRAAFERTLIDRGGLLLPSWQFELEPSLSYQNTSNDRILVDGFTILPVLVVGDIVSERVQREQYTQVVSARLGLPADLQLDLSVPYLYEELQIVTAENDEAIRADHGLGDVSLSLSWHARRARNGFPDLLAALTWKFDNGRSPFDIDFNESAFGSGYQSLDARMTAVKVVDPVVYFGGLNYTYNFETNEDIGRFEPGDSVGFNLGLALALNLSSSISFSYDQLMTGHSRLGGQSLPGSDATVGLMTLGGNYATENYALDFSVGLGVTSDAPDVLIRMAVPLSNTWR